MEPTNEAVPLNIYQRLNEVRKAVAYIQKDKDVGSGNWSYKAITHDAVTAAVRDHLITHGILVIPMVQESKVSPTGTTTAKGVPHIRYEARFAICFHNIDKPEDHVEVRLDAHAIDEGDKAPGKATSYATKYAMLKLFSIETGEAEEGRDPDAKAETVTQEQIFTMHAYCEEHGLNGDETLKAMAIKAFGLKAASDLPKDRFDEAMDLLKLKVKSNGAKDAGVEGSKGGKDNRK